jgi:uncharacterized protein YggE
MIRIETVCLGLLAAACAPATIPATAQQAPPDSPRTLEVSASAAVTRAPDRAVVDLAVETMAETARAATAGNAESMTAVLTALEDLGIERSDIQTRSISLNPRYDRRPNAEEPVIVGYQAANRVAVPVADVGAVGRVIDAAVGAGANRVMGIRFELANPEAAYHEALQRAVAQARREAEVAAEALGEVLGPPIRVSTGGLSTPPGPTPEFMAMARTVETPVQPGELEIGATVHITYRLGS